MIHSLANRVASVFVAHGECSEENADIYAYAAEAVIAFLVNLLICLLIALAFGRVREGLAFIFGFALLRWQTGGYHASTHLKCILTFSCIVVCAMAILTVSAWLEVNGFITIVISTFAVIGVFAIKTIDTSLREMKKHNIGIIFGFWLFSIIAFYTLNGQIGLSLALSMFFVFGSMAYAVYTKDVAPSRKEVNGEWRKN